MSNDNPPSLLELERWATGRLSHDETSALQARRDADPDLDDRMRRVEASVQDAAMDLPPLELSLIHI